MRTYPEYKDSNVEWIGEIPEGWKLTKSKYSLSVKYGFPFSSDFFDLVDGTPILRIRDITTGKLETFYTGVYDKDYLLGEDSLLVGMDGDFNIRWWKGPKFLLNQRCCSLNPFEKLNKRFLYYQLPHELKIINDTKHYSTVKHLSDGDMYNLNIILPPLSEQKQISDYLDRKTQQIDDLIEKTERKIELLKEQRSSLINQCVTKGLDPNVEMKDSGVEWIGEIPKGWKVSRIKYLTNLISKGTTPSTIGEEIEDDGEIRYLKSENIIDQKISLVPEFSISNETDQILKRSRLFVDDVLIVIAGAMIGKTAIVYEEIIPANTNQAVCFIRPKKKFLSKMIWYWFQTGYIETQLKTLSVTSAQPNLSMENIGNFSIVLHGEDSWRDISNHLDHETSKIDQMVDTETKRIDLLKEYRQSLISNVVTGKIDVRDEIVQ